MNSRPADDAPAPSEPYGWWGLHWDVPESLSLVQLVAAGNFDARTAALLWLLIEARASLIVAADPPGAGKTTTLTALSDFLPPATERIFLRGWHETFDFLATTPPDQCYLLCNEISSHLPVYLWGRHVNRLFAAVEQGYGFGATMHADTPDEVIDILAGYPLYIPSAAIAQLDLVLNLAVEYRNRRPHRHLTALTLLRRTGTGTAIDPCLLARWDDMAQRVVWTDPLPAGLSQRLGLTPTAFLAVLEERTAFITTLVGQGELTRAALRAALQHYRQGDQRAETSND